MTSRTTSSKKRYFVYPIDECAPLKTLEDAKKEAKELLENYSPAGKVIILEALFEAKRTGVELVPVK